MKSNSGKPSRSGVPGRARRAFGLLAWTFAFFTGWAGVSASPDLTALQGEIDRICQRLGLPADPRKFSPHVTLARLRNASPLDVAQYLSARGNFAALPFRVGRFVLMSSRDSVGGGPYIVEEAWPLVGETLTSSRFASASDASRIMR